MTDESDFFRETTLRLCGSLEIEKALWESFLYFRDYIPAEEMFLNLYDPELGLIETIVRVDSHGGQAISVKTSLPPEVRTILAESLFRSETVSNIYRVERMSDHGITAFFSRTLHLEDGPALIMRPELEGKLMGGVVLVNTPGKPYSEEHAHLLRILNRPFAIALSNYLRYREVLRLKDILADDNRYLHEELRGQIGEEIVGSNFGLKGTMEMVRQVAPLSSPVLLIGETGAGKEVIASAIHKFSPRRDGPFIKVNCGAIPPSLMDSELFGHERGAFTGALSQKRGRFERAHGGTIFLDEIGELLPEAQVRLLRVLQEKEIERVGGSEPIRVDIRVIAATHRNLEAMLSENRFREDLYFRLHVFPIHIPPLRDRMADLPALVHHFIQKRAREMGLASVPGLAAGALDRLMNYSWPGNVRELQNAVERALILSGGKLLTFDDIALSVREGPREKPGLPETPLPGLEQAVSRHILKALEMAGGKVGGKGGAAERLLINPSTLRKKMKRLGIPFGRRARQMRSQGNQTPSFSNKAG